MICIYSKNNTEYSKNGDAVLIPTSCYVSMTINGAWSLTLEHPYDPEERYKYIVEGAVIRVDLKCINELTSVQQRFRIYQYTKNMHSVSCIAFPIAMESTYDSPIDNLVITNKTGAEAMALLQAYTEKYTLSTDITAQKSSSFANTNINNAIASGDDNCFISVWGGEILYDNLNYSVKSSLGNSNSGLEIRYGRNLSAIERQTDDSGLTTRIKPISKDGIRLNGTGYVDSPKISDYPIIHTRYMTVPYNLIEDDVSSNSATAVATRSTQAAVSSATSTLSESSYSTALGAGYQPEYIKSIKDDIISAVQTMALTNVISISLYNYLSKTIASAMSWLGNLEQPAWDWHGSYESGWWYGNDDGYARNEYVRIGKKWSYFGDNGYWQEPADDSDEWDWYQVAGEEGKRYGNFKKYYAHNTYVYITMNGTLTKYWFDSDGWYDSEKTDESDWSWHGSGTAEDPYWFGDPDAEGDEKKYAHSTWLFIDGTYYFFDEFGYYDGTTKFDDYSWDWVESGENFWFGNAEDDTYAATYVTSQWLKINGSWYYFDSNGYVVSENSSKSAAVSIFTSGMASLATTVNTQATTLYNVLYGLMTDYANKQYSEGVDVPAITITVNMVDLSKTTEYAGYANLETVKLGDSVTVKDDEHNISLTSRIIGLTYDCVRDYNAEVVIGSPSKSVSEILGNAGGTPVAGGFDTSAIEEQLEALQDKVGDVIMNGASVVDEGVADFTIQAGENISISRDGRTLTISGEGGQGLEYFVETEHSLYGNGISRQYFQYDRNYKFNGSVTFTNVEPKNAEYGTEHWHQIATNVDQNDLVGIRGARISVLSNSYADGIFIISKNQSHCTFTIKYYNAPWPDDTTLTGEDTYSYTSEHNVRYHMEHVDNNINNGACSDSFVFEGETYYIVTVAEYSNTWSTNDKNGLAHMPEEDGYLARGTYQTLGAWGLAVMQAYKTGNNLYNGMCRTRDDGLAFFAGGTDANGTDAPIKIYSDGHSEGLGTQYVAGDNINIEGNTINGAYSAFSGTDGLTDGAAGLVPAPTVSDKNKVLKGDGTWGNVVGTSPLAWRELDETTYNNLTTDEKNNGTVYFITDGQNVADGKTYIWISETDYNNLSQAEKENNIPYFIYND